MIEREDNIIYEIDENTVTARYTEPWARMLCKEINSTFQDSNVVFPNVWDFMACHCYKECGIAKCCPNDKFDKQFGKKLAKERLVTKYNRMRFMYFKKVRVIIKKAHKIVISKSLKYYKASTYRKKVKSWNFYR